MAKLRREADALGGAPVTVRREWTLAKAWLRHELGKGASGD
ncbi:MAG TPA: hypothetical protein VE715_02750 [Blastocatellia bacterium]|nr:hypothetical protein [Blastocatellia bacterium]